MQSFTERLKQTALQLEARRMGILANQTAYDLQSGEYSFQALARSADQLRVFLPEHGLFAELQDQVGLEDTRTYAACLTPEERQKTEFLSLYGNSEGTLKPDAGLLADLDLLVVDLQDVGSRYYTFLTTLYYCLEVIRDIRSSRPDSRLRCLVVDRPNPIGRIVEGTLLGEEYASFVGLPGILHRHGLSAGEMARFFARRLKLDSDTLIVLQAGSPGLTEDGAGEKAEDKMGLRSPVEPAHWTNAGPGAQPERSKRMTSFPVYPSPNMPTVETARVYPGQCLLEGTNLSEGRGSTRPFLIFGAPFLGSLPFSTSLFLPGLRLRPLRFLPTFHKHAGQICEGFELHVLDDSDPGGGPGIGQSAESDVLYAPLFCTLRILRWIRASCPDFAWQTGVYEFRSDRPAIELLAGDPLLLEYLRNAPAPREDRLDDYDLAILEHMATQEGYWMEGTGFLWEDSPLHSSSARLLARFA